MDFIGVDYISDDVYTKNNKERLFNLYDYIEGSTLYLNGMCLNDTCIYLPSYIKKIIIKDCSFLYIVLSEKTKLKCITFKNCFNVFMEDIHNIKQIETLKVCNWKHIDDNDNNMFIDLIDKLYLYQKNKNIYVEFTDDGEFYDTYEISNKLDDLNEGLDKINSSNMNKYKKQQSNKLAYDIVNKYIKFNDEHKNIFTELITSYL